MSEEKKYYIYDGVGKDKEKVYVKKGVKDVYYRRDKKGGLRMSKTSIEKDKKIIAKTTFKDKTKWSNNKNQGDYKNNY